LQAGRHTFCESSLLLLLLLVLLLVLLEAFCRLARSSALVLSEPLPRDAGRFFGRRGCAERAIWP